MIHAIFSRFGLVLIPLLQVGCCSASSGGRQTQAPLLGGSVVVTSAMVIYPLNSKMHNSAKINDGGGCHCAAVGT